MRRLLKYILIFLLANIVLPSSAATYTIDTWNGANPLYFNSFTTDSDLNFTTNITDSTTNINTYLGGTKTLRFNGGGYYLSGNSAYRGFQVSSGGNYTFNNLTIQNFTPAGVASGGFLMIDSGGSSSAINSTFNTNSATTSGGAIYNAGTLNVGTNVSTADSTLFRNNNAYNNNGNGGAIYNTGTLNSICATGGNVITYAGNYTGHTGSVGGNGGAIYNNGGTVTITGNTLSWNGYRDYNGTSGTNVSTNQAGAIFNSGGTVTISNSTFYHNAAIGSAGAILNGSGATFNIGTGGTTDTTIFEGNNGGSYAGAIENFGIVTIGSSGSTKAISFIGNHASIGGGAIGNPGVVTSYAGVTFAGNYANDGGAILNFGGGSVSTIVGNTFSWNGYSDYNGISGSILDTTFYGGAIHNSGTLTITDSTFSNNAAIINGGAIYNQGTLRIRATADGTAGYSTSFTTATDTVYLNGAGMALNTGTNGLNIGTINFNGNVGSSAIGNVININDSAVDAGLTTGTINFNATVSDATINMHNGVLQFGSNAVAASSTYTSNVDINLSGGTLSLQNNQAGDVLNLRNFTITNSPTVRLDANLATNTSDRIAISGTGSGAIVIGTLNILADSASTSGQITIASGVGASGLTYSGFTAYTNDYTYTFTTNATKGIFDYTRPEGGGLNAAVADTTASRLFSATKDESVIASLGAMGGAGSTLTINGNGFSVNGAGYSGITVASGQTLNISGVGGASDSWYGHVTTGNGGVVDNAGTMTVLNSVFYNNQATVQGGVLNNTGTLTIGTNASTADSTLFRNNAATGGGSQGGAIYNEGTLNSLCSTGGSVITYAGNYANNGSGGAIRNSGGGAVATITGNTFSWNGYSDYNGTAANTISTQNGGAISNNGGTINIRNSTFNNNAANSWGGAIEGWGSLTIGTSGSSSDTTVFRNNFAAWGGGGAISANNLTSYGGVIFEGNYAGPQGGAINVYGGNTTIIENIFRYNGYSDYDGNTASTVATTSGGAINTSDTATITNSTFNNNAATGNGGAIYNTGTLNIGTNPSTADSTLFRNNAATGGSSEGGVIYNTGTVNSLCSTSGNRITYAGNYSGYVGGVLSNTGASANATFNGNIFKWNGYSDYDSGGDTASTVTNWGGMIFNTSGATVTIRNTLLRNNAGTEAGGAIFNDNGSTIHVETGTSFLGNYAVNAGGAINNGGALTIDSATFSWNGYSDYIYASNTATTVAARSGGAIQGNGGVTIKNSTFNNNAVTDDGGAIYNNGGTVTIGTNGQTNDTTVFRNNSSGNYGGAIYNNGGTVTSHGGVTFAGNYCNYGGSAINSSGASAVLNIINNTFSWNGYSDYNGTLGTTVVSESAAIRISNGSSLTVADSLFTHNAGLYGNSAIYNDESNAVITNSTFSYNAPGAVFNSGTMVIGTDGGVDTTLFRNNGGGGAGGAIYNADGSLSIYSGVTFAGNYVDEGWNVGGAIFVQNGTASIEGTTFSYNGYNNYNGTTASTIVTQYGGAIQNGATTTLQDSTFSNNAATYRGGAIRNEGSLTISGSTVFSNNIVRGPTFQSYGGAIYNNSGATAILSITGATFTDNAVHQLTDGNDARGGAIANLSTNASNLITGSTFDGNYVDTTGAYLEGLLGGAIYNEGVLTVSTSTFGTSSANTAYRGGAIYNESGATLTITDSTFTDNVATSLGGAIYNAGTLNIQANAANTTFTTATDTIYLAGGTMNLNAGTGRTINFTGAISSSASGNTVNINDSAVNGSLTAGTINIDSTIANASLSLKAGTLSFGANATSAATYTSGIVNLTMTGGTLSMQNNYAGDVLNLNNFTAGGSGVRLDANLSSGVLDYITIAGTGAGSITIATLNILADASSAIGQITLVSGTGSTGLTYSGFTASSGSYKYSFTPNATAGIYDYTRGYLTLHDAVIATDHPRSYTLTEDENLAISLGTMGGANSTLTVNGGGYSVNGTGYAGITVNSGQTLNISGVGAMSGNNVTASWNGQVRTGNGGVADNAGTMTVLNSVFYNNQATVQGGVFNNSGTLNIGTNASTADSTLFRNNNAYNSDGLGGAIYNTGTLNSVCSTSGNRITYAGNYTGHTGALGGNGGAIRNTGTLNINGNIFSWNGYRDYNGTSGANVSTDYGGAISNGNILNIKNSTFSNNAATWSGGAIYNQYADLTIGTNGNTDTTVIRNNSSEGQGGAIYNSGVLISYSGVTFAGNTAGWGGAIHSENGGDVTIVGNTFKWNGYGDYDYGNDTATTVTAGSTGAVRATHAASITDSVFRNNAAGGAGGALLIGTSGTVTNTTFAGNFVTYDGGAFYNYGTTSIVGSTFKWNGYSNYVVGTDIATTIATANGGAIYNDTGSVLTIKNSTINNNAANSNAGAIYNVATLNIGTDASTADSTLFRNNNAYNNNGSGGAIYNTGTLNSLCSTSGNRITLAGNYTGHTGSLGGNGGAIYQTGASAIATITGNTFEWNGYYDYNGTSGTNVSTANGGAIYNNTGATMTVTDSAFSNNAAGSAGAIYNNTGTVTVTGSTFSYNSASQHGGAILNNSGSTLAIEDSTFDHNTAVYDGGAIVNNSNINLTIQDTTFSNNSSGRDGGAIYNDSGATLTVTDSTFSNNSATNNGGAIYNAGTLHLEATASHSTSFTTATDTVYLAGAGMTLNAGGSGGTAGTINFNSNVGSNDIANVIKINDSSVNAGLATGTINFNATVSDATINMYNGLLQFGSNAVAASSTYTSNVDVNLSGGTLSLQNNQVGDVLNLHNFTITNSPTVNLDANLATGTVDRINISGTGSGTITVAVLNILADSASTSGQITIASGAGASGLTYSDFVANSSSYKYTFTANATKGLYDYLRSYLSLHSTVIATDANRSYTLTADEDVVVNLGTMGGANSTLTINGAGYSINGYGYAGITVASGQTLNISGVGGVSDSWNTQITSGIGGVVNNAGTVNIRNSVMNYNYASTQGGLIYNSGTLKIGVNAQTVDTSVFRGNSVGNNGNGGAIYNTGSLTSVCSTGANVITFAGNYTGSSGVGGAIYNTGSSAVAIITGNTFSWNGYSDYNGTSGSTVVTQSGGAIFNNATPAMVITDSTFNRNAATDYGGAIVNEGTMTIVDSNFTNNKATVSGGAIYNHYGSLTIGTDGGSDTTSFVNNVSSGQGGAIYNSGSLTSYSGVTFAGNTSTSAYGGAIHSENGGNLTIIGNTFKWNGYGDYNSGSDTASTVSTSYVGAINLNSGTANISDTLFRNNAATYSGGAISSYNATLNVSTSTFAGNFDSSYGGALSNSGTSANTTISDSTFSWNGYSNYNGTSASAVSTQYGGAVYNEDSTIKIINSAFANNAASVAGGAVYAGAGSKTYIQADGTGNQSNFSGNTANGVSSAIHLAGTNATTNAANLYLNAGNSGVINVDDNITGSNASYNNLYVNSNNSTASTCFIDGTHTLTNGRVNLNGDITGNTVTVAGSGNTYFGQSGSVASGYYSGTTFNLGGSGTQYFYNGISGATLNTSVGTQNFNSAITSSTITSSGGTQNIAGAMTASTLNVSGGTVNLTSAGSIATTALNLNSGTLDLRNSQMDTLSLTNFNANALATLRFDADLSDGTNDKLSVSGTATGTLTGLVNITADASGTGGTLTLVNGSDISGLTLSNIATTYTTNYAYTFTGSNSGTYTINRDYKSGLNSAVVATEASRAFSATSDETVASNLGTMGGAGSTLTIFGNNHSILGSGNSGINVLSGQTLDVQDVGSIDGSNNIVEAYQGFASTSGGAVINNAGTLNVSETVFSSNSTTQSGGVLYNTGSATLTDTTFSGNTATVSGGAIYNAGTLYIKASAGGLSQFKTTTDTIRLASGTMYVNAGALGSVNFNAAVSSANQANNIYINALAGDASLRTGTININNALSNSTVSMQGGTVNFAGASLSDLILTASAGTVNFDNSTTSNDNTYNFSGATVNFNGTSLPGDTINISDGTVNFNSGTVSTTDTINVTGGTVNATSASFTSDTVAISGGTTTSTSSTFSNTSIGITGGNQLFTNTIFNNGTKITLNNTNLSESASINSSTFTSAGSTSGNGGAINLTAGNLNITNTSFANYSATGTGGAIYNKGVLNIIADGSNVAFTNNTSASTPNDIYLDTGAILNLNASANNKITFNGGIKSSGLSNNININKIGSSTVGDPPTSVPVTGEVVLNSAISNSTVNLYGGTLSVANENYLNGNNLTFNSNGGNVYSTLNLLNNSVGIMNLNSLALNSSAYLKIDADLAARTADYITASSVSGAGKLMIDRVNLLSDEKSNNAVNITVADANVKNNVALNSTSAESALYKYNMTYNSATGGMSFVNTHQFTPAVQATAIAYSAGTFMNQVNTYSEALSRTDTFMSLPSSDRLLLRYSNKYAAAGEPDIHPTVFSPTLLPEGDAGIWFKQFTSFENVPLNNGPNVSNVGYGALIGGDTALHRLKLGFDGYMTAYVGYNGSHQNYDRVGVYQNGGLLGLTGTVYKGNFFATMTANVGESSGDASTPNGSDYFNTLIGGLATKTGYNIEFMRGKMILQPSLMMSYTFAKTFDYETAAGASITSFPMHVLQISPGAKLIGNLRNGWQPYLGANMVWNIMDKQQFYANDVPLPQMSVAPYLEYGFGGMRRWGERLGGYAQVMFRGGGRNGVAFQFGLRYSLGK